jgi:Chloroplast import apparatus Tic20-like
MPQITNIEPRDRFYASLPYLLPLSAVVIFGAKLLQMFLPLQYIFFPFFWLYSNILMFPVVPILGLNGEFVILIGLYLLVTKDARINHFVRFNIMQAILLEIIIFLTQLSIKLLAVIIGNIASVGLVLEVLGNTVFLGIVAACIYAIAQNIAGKYTEIPGISEAAAIQCN